MATKIPVSERALVARINRKLRQDAEALHRSRGTRFWSDLGDYYIVDFRRNSLVRGHVDIEELAHELGVLKPWESLAAELEDSADVR